MATALQCAGAEQVVPSPHALLQRGACSVDTTGVMNTMPHQGSDDPRKLREVLARTQTLAAEHAVASVVVGGTALAGGKGSYWGTMAGALVLTLITSLLTAMQLPEAFKQITLGLILLVLISVYGRQRGLRQ